jgi:hypothetical protein
VLFELVPLITLGPRGTISGQLLYGEWDRDVKYTIYFIVETLLFAFNCVSFCVLRRLTSASAYMNETPWSCFEPGTQAAFYIVSAVGSGLTEFYLQVGQWLNIPTALVHAGVTLWVLWRNCAGSAFLYPTATKIVIAFLVSAVVCDLVQVGILSAALKNPEVTVDVVWADVLAPVADALAALAVPDAATSAAQLTALISGLTIDAVTPHGSISVERLRATLRAHLRMLLADGRV